MCCSIIEVFLGTILCHLFCGVVLDIFKWKHKVVSCRDTTSLR